MDETAQWRLQPKQAYAALLLRQGLFAPHSRAQYCAMLGAATDWIQQHRGRSLLDLDSTDLHAFTQQFVGKNGHAPSPATIVRYIKRLDHVMAYLVAARLRRDNPVAQLGATHAAHEIARSDPPFLSWAQSESYIDWVKLQPCVHWVDIRNRALRLIFLGSGITVAECRGLQLSDVIWQEKAVHLRVRQGSAKAHRIVPLPAWCESPLKAWVSTRKDIVDRHPGSWARESASPSRPKDFLFLGKSKAGGVQHDGSDMVAKAMSASELYEVVRPAVSAVCSDKGLQLGPQTLRNTFILRQLHAAIDAHLIVQWLGLKTTFSVEAMRPFARHVNCPGG